MRKWNNKTERYDDYIPPKEWKVLMYSDDMDMIINCAQCGRELTYGQAYSSQEIHNNIGFGYMVCGECNHAETMRRIKKSK